MKRIIAFLSVVLVSLFSAVTFGTIFDINPVVPGVASFVMSFVPLPQGSLYNLVFTAPGGAATPFAYNCKGLPQFITWNDGGNPLTSFRIETQEDGVLIDLVAAGIAAINGFMVVGAQTANVVLLRCANGNLANKSVTMSGVTSAAGAIGFFYASDTYGTRAFKYTTAAIIANNPTVFKDFTALWVPALAAGELCTITYRSGYKQVYNINDLTALSVLYQEAPGIIINNANAYIHEVEFLAAANRVAYVQSVVL